MAGLYLTPGDINMKGISYIEVGEHGLNRIEPLWKKLVDHLKVRSTYFGEWFETRSFDERRAELLKKSTGSGGKLHVDLAMNGGQCIGYCVSSMVQQSGEVDSIFVEESYRYLGIGSELMKRALAWIDDEQPQGVRVASAIGNEEVLPFYQRYGFFPRMTLLELKKD